jgi:hypothetical protein
MITKFIKKTLNLIKKYNKLSIDNLVNKFYIALHGF